LLSLSVELPILSNPISNEEFFKIFSDLNREEFNIPTAQAFLKLIAFEGLIEEKFIEFIKDYKIGFEKLQRPLMTGEYATFIQEKESPLKLYFQYLKEYLWKLTTQTTITNYLLAYLMKSYDDCSICDIFAITEDFSMKFNICYILNKMQKDINPNEMTTLQRDLLSDILFLYSSTSELKWMDFSSGDNPFDLKFRPKFLTIEKNNNVKVCAEVNNECFALDLEKEFVNYSLICQENQKFRWSPIPFQEYIADILGDKYKDLELNFMLMEEIKLISTFILFEDIKSKETQMELNTKWGYFILVSFLCNELMNSSKKLIFSSPKYFI